MFRFIAGWFIFIAGSAFSIHNFGYQDNTIIAIFCFAIIGASIGVK